MHIKMKDGRSGIYFYNVKKMEQTKTKVSTSGKNDKSKVESVRISKATSI